MHGSVTKSDAGLNEKPRDITTIKRRLTNGTGIGVNSDSYFFAIFTSSIMKDKQKGDQLMKKVLKWIALVYFGGFFVNTFITGLLVKIEVIGEYLKNPSAGIDTAAKAVGYELYPKWLFRKL